MTGIDTAAMIPSIMSGSLIRETPPWARMSAGTRSRAMTATAPASSAMRACSAVTTSMMTPPLSISAMPRLTRVVPVVLVPVALVPDCWSPAGVLPEVGVVLTMSCFPVYWSGAATKGRPPCRVPTTRSVRQPQRAAGRRRACSPRPPGSHRGEVLRRLVVELDGVRHRRVAGEVEEADGPLAPHAPDVGDGIVVEPPRQLHPRAGRADPGEDVLAERGRAKLGHDVGRQGEVEGLGEVVLGELALLAVVGRCLERPGRGVGEDQRRGAVEQAAVGELHGGLGPADETGVERGEGAAEPHVQPVEPGGGVGEVPGRDDEDEQDREDPGEDLAHRPPPRRKLFQRPCGSHWAAARPSMTVS